MRSLLSAEDSFLKCLLVKKLRENEFCNSNIVKYVGVYQLFTLTERISF
jgi:hypothetical protein